MAYVAPVHKPTSIRHAIRIRFLSPDEDNLIVAKANRLEIWRLKDDGMDCLHSKILYGTVAMMQKLVHKDFPTEMLFIGTDRLQYFTLIWNPDTKALDTVEQTLQDASEPYMRNSQSQNKCLVDPTGKYMMMHLWEGVFNGFRLTSRRSSARRLENLGQVRLTELWIKDSTFLHSRTGHPKVAFLYQTKLDREEARVAVYRLTKDDKGSEISAFDVERDRELDQVIADPYTSMIIPVPVVEEKRYHVRNTEGASAHLGGLLLIGETSISYFDSLTYVSVTSYLEEAKIYVAWADIDDTHFFLADDYGRLDLLTIETAQEPAGRVVSGMKVERISYADGGYTTPRAAKLVYMGDGTLFLASHHGNSSLLHVDLESMQMVEITPHSNNAPILDFAIMDMGNREGDFYAGNAFSSGQARIVAGCGAYQDGSLRSIRSGVDLKEHGMLDDMQNITGMFSVRSTSSKSIDTLIMSFIGETRILRFGEEGDIEELFDFSGLALDEETLYASNLASGQFLYMTSTSVVLLDPESGVTVNRWDAPGGSRISAASANEKWALVALDGLTLVSLNLADNLAATEQKAPVDSKTGQPDQIACLSASRDLPGLGVIGWWASGAISVVSLATLSPIHGENLRQTEDSASVPRDIALVQLHPSGSGSPTLLIALEDGNVITFDVTTNGGFSLSGRKSVTLGSSPARFHTLPQADGPVRIFATTEHSSLIYSSEGRIIYSATTADEATHVVPFDSAAYPDSIVLSIDDGLRICQVDNARLTHVKTLTVQETVRRVAYSPVLKAFGLGCINKTLVNNEEVVTSTFKIVDEIVFKELGSPFVLDASATLEMVECVMRAELPDSNGNLVERFVVGTSFVTEDEIVEGGLTSGRILILGVDEQRRIYQVASHSLKGSCRCLALMEGPYIVAGLSKTVVVYSFDEEVAGSGSLTKLAAYRPSAYPVDLDINGTVIGVADLMQSLSLVEFMPPAGGEPAKLVERARHYESAWATSISHLGNEKWLEADAQGNIVILRRNTEAPLERDRKRMEVTSEMNLGEQINRIRRLYVATSENAVIVPQAFLGSVEGSLYLLGEVSPTYQDLLLSFQTRLKDYIAAPGNTDFDEWRAFRNDVREAAAPFRFIDGEMIEKFLDLDEEMQTQVCEGLGPSVEDMRGLVEELRRAH